MAIKIDGIKIKNLNKKRGYENEYLTKDRDALENELNGLGFDEVHSELLAEVFYTRGGRIFSNGTWIVTIYNEMLINCAKPRKPYLVQD